MATADQLIALATAFGDEHPRHLDFAKQLIALVQKIDREFTGEAHQRLLTDARSTLQRHTKIVESTEQTLEALEKLKQQQARLTEALTELAMIRPPDATLH